MSEAEAVDLTVCRTCRATVLRGMNRCENCGDYQNWRRHLSSALLMLVLGVPVVVLGLAVVALARIGAVKSLGEFKDLAAGVQSLIFALGLIVGGAWTWWTGRVLMQGAIMRVKGERELKAARLRPNVLITVVARQEILPDDPRLFISGYVEMENNGNHPAHLQYKWPLVVAGIRITESGHSEMVSYQMVEFVCPPPPSNVVDSGAEAPPALEVVADELIDAGSKSRHPFFITASHPGLFLVECRVPIDVRRVAVVKQQDLDKFHAPRTYSGKAYVVIAGRPLAV